MWSVDVDAREIFYPFIERKYMSEQDQNIIKVQEELRAGNKSILEEIQLVLSDDEISPGERALMLEILTTSKTTHFIKEITEEIIKALQSRDEELILTAINKSNNLPITYQNKIIPYIRKHIRGPSNDAHRAAKESLRSMVIK